MTRTTRQILSSGAAAVARLRTALIRRGGLAFLTATAGIMAASILVSPQASAAGCGGCGPSEAPKEQSPQAGTHAGHGQAMAALQPAGPGARAPATVVSILEHYAKVHAALAADTVDGVSGAARAIANLVTGDGGKSLPPELGAQAEALSKAEDLAAARAAFKPLSASLSRHLGAQKIQTRGHYQMYCSMANAGWIQNDEAVKNPYYGKSMLACGELVGSY